ncbi:TPA: plasmid recombination protein [Escherichia coli]|nr:hypothetical protein [Salmonella enterica]HBE7821877.1 plasmid recombination protein [Escherichia coli]
MASAQFIHIETYGKKSAKKAERKNLNHNSDVRQTTISGVLAEARRDVGFTSHIEDPHAPALLWGSPLHEVEQMAEDYYNNTYTVDKNGKQKRLRSDASIILAGVISIDRKDEEIWSDYKKDAFKFLREKYGDKLKCVIEHVDEAHPHIHFYALEDPGGKLNDLHDGKRAVANLTKEEKKNQQFYYTKAMTEFQDEFYDKVSKKYGLDRIGEKPKTRLSRSEYLKQQQEKTNANLILNEKKEQIKDLNSIVEKAEKEGSKHGYKFAIDEFKNKSILAKISFSMSKEVKFTKSENERLIRKNNREIKRQRQLKEELKEKDKEKEQLKKDHALELSEQFQKNKETSKNLYLTLQKNEFLTKENSQLLEENNKYKNGLEKLIEPIVNENSKLKSTVNFLNKRENSNQNFFSKLKAFYGEKYNDWVKSILDHEKPNVSNDKSLKPK